MAQSDLLVFIVKAATGGDKRSWRSPAESKVTALKHLQELCEQHGSTAKTGRVDGTPVNTDKPRLTLLRTDMPSTYSLSAATISRLTP